MTLIRRGILCLHAFETGWNRLVGIAIRIQFIHLRENVYTIHNQQTKIRHLR